MVPEGEIRVEDIVSRSRFITSLAPASTREQALDFIDRIKDEFADATHNCWAYLVGPPGTTACVGASDDGEPHNTAGRPILSMLEHSGVGDVAVVVTRYFGGVKLGKGGLIRAYGGGAKRALEQVERIEKVALVRAFLSLDYTFSSALKRAYDDYGIELTSEDYTDKVMHFISLPADELDKFSRYVFNLTNGRVEVKLVEEND